MRKPARVFFLAALAPEVACAAPVGTADYLTALLSLVLILGGFVAVAFLMKRWLPRAPGASVVRLVGSTPVGVKERVVVVEIADTWLVLGVGGGQVRALHEMARPDSASDTPGSLAVSRPASSDDETRTQP